MASSASHCPVCDKEFPADQIESHVNKCLFLNSQSDPMPSTQSGTKRSFKIFETPNKKLKHSEDDTSAGSASRKKDHHGFHENIKSAEGHIPLAESLRPTNLKNYVGQHHILGPDKIFRQLIESNKIPSMILWGPPGCGKTTLAHIIHKASQQKCDVRFVKLSATMAGVSDIKEIVQIAKNELSSLKRHTLLFMDEIHRFNKLQQDIFLPHVESGLITLIGATTENPSFSLNSALLSRCKVLVLEKLSSEDLMALLYRAAGQLEISVVEDDTNLSSPESKCISSAALRWLSEVSDGDARICINSLQMAVESLKTSNSSEMSRENPELSRLITLEDIKDGIKRSHLLYDRKGDEHYNMISALHKSIRASDDNAAIYWLMRMLEGGEDPLFIARRLVRAAAEDVGLVDPMALTLAVSAMQGCQLIGMPECDVLLAQAAVYLARTEKSREMDSAVAKARLSIKNHKGPLPSVPLHLRNASTRLMSELGYGKGYNMRHKESSNLSYMPEGMENSTFF